MSPRVALAAALIAFLGAGGAASLPSASKRVPALPDPRAAEAADALLRERGAGLSVRWRRATGVARSVRFEGDARRAAAPDESAEATVRAELRRHPALFGLVDPDRELVLERAALDRHGLRHLYFRQERLGVPVFGALLAAHFDLTGALASLNGLVVPLERAIGVVPAITIERAREVARRYVAGKLAPRGAAVEVGPGRLVLFALGLDRGDRFDPRLAWEMVTGDRGLARFRIFVDARSGKPLDALPLVADALDRQSFTGLDQSPFDGIPDSWPDLPDWIEGDPFPTGDAERDAALAATADAYALFAVLGRDSYDGLGHRLDLSWNRASFCPNASWNGLLTSFCAGFAAHDVVVHEWAHAYTEATHGLIYRWQSGALNESYSDLWGELADQSSALVAGRDVDAPSNRRADGSCSEFTPARLKIVAPNSLAGDLEVGLAAFGAPPTAMASTPIVLADDAGGADANDACEPVTNLQSAGAILFAHRGDCAFEVQARHAQAAGAAALVVGNLASSPDPDLAPQMGCDPIQACDRAIIIPAVSLAVTEASALANAFAAGTVRGAVAAGDNSGGGDSVRWLLGEDVRPLGVARDMWTPSCLGQPDRTTDALYRCSSADNGGVHSNSGVPNRAFALLVDGGRANGIDVPAIGRVGAAQLYWRAQSVYQQPYSDFSDHADALETACADLIGIPLDDPWGGPPKTLVAGDCAAVAGAIAAVELRAEPPCELEPVLDKNPPPLCSADEYEIERASFDVGADGYLAFRREVAKPATFDERDWTRATALPEGRAGAAYFAPDPRAGSCVTQVGGDDESGVLVLESPELGAPNGLPLRLAFDQFVATEEGWDGGNLKISLDGGPWRLIPASAFLFNEYRGDLAGPSSGSSNPLRGEPAFHGLDEGSNSGSWGRSLIDLSEIVNPGERFRLRFELGTDECAGTFQGWYVDEVRLALCVSAPPIFLDGFEGATLERWSATTP